MHNILNEYDPNPNAVINPWDIITPIPDFPALCIGAFSKPIVDKFCALENVTQIGALNSANGSTPIYQIDYQGTKAAFFMCPVGAALCAAMMDDLIAKGAKKFIYFGSCGVLDHRIADGHIIVPTIAVRDEGTSYHYLPAADEIELNPNNVRAVVDTLEELQIPYVTGKVWTTDAFYRETPAKLEKRKQSGCIAVEMECAALAAVAQFRKIPFAQFVYAADNLDCDSWDKRGLGDQGFTHSDNYMKVAFEAGKKLG